MRRHRALNAKRHWNYLAAIALSLALGCGSTATTDSESGGDPPSKATSSATDLVDNPSPSNSPSNSPSEPTFEPQLAVAAWDEIRAKVAEQKGKVVVVDLWSTSCEPCLRELPGLVKLQQKFPERVVCMSVNLDYTGAAAETPESHREKVKRVIETRKMDFPNFISSTSDFDVYDTIKLASIPAVLVYDLTGATEAIDPAELQPVRRFDNDLNQYGDEGFSYTDHITPLVEATLEK